MTWDRKLWGVEFTGQDGRSMLCGSAWHADVRQTYPSEPPRALLFSSRAAARKWCAAKILSYAHRTDLCAAWKFRPVRVREIVMKIDG